MCKQPYTPWLRQQYQSFLCARSSRSPEGKKEVKGLHSTFAKAEAETVQPEKADHLILPAQKVDAAYPSQPSDRYCAWKAVMSQQATHGSFTHRAFTLLYGKQAN